VLKDRSPEAPFFASDFNRVDNFSNEKIRIFSEGTSWERNPDHEEMSIAIDGIDPRGSSSSFDYSKLRDAALARADVYTYKLSPVPDGNTIIGELTARQVDNIKQTGIMDMKNRLDIWDESMTNMNPGILPPGVFDTQLNLIDTSRDMIIMDNTANPFKKGSNPYPEAVSLPALTTNTNDVQPSFVNQASIQALPSSSSTSLVSETFMDKTGRVHSLEQNTRRQLISTTEGLIRAKHAQLDGSSDGRKIKESLIDSVKAPKTVFDYGSKLGFSKSTHKPIDLGTEIAYVYSVQQPDHRKPPVVGDYASIKKGEIKELIGISKINSNYRKQREGLQNPIINRIISDRSKKYDRSVEGSVQLGSSRLVDLRDARGQTVYDFSLRGQRVGDMPVNPLRIVSTRPVDTTSVRQLTKDTFNSSVLPENERISMLKANPYSTSTGLSFNFDGETHDRETNKYLTRRVAIGGRYDHFAGQMDHSEGSLNDSTASVRRFY
jgi:hypothetical protein